MIYEEVEEEEGATGEVDDEGRQVYEMIACALVLWVQYWQKKVVNLEVEMTVQERIFSERRRQFEQSISNIDVINHKCHDLKYQIQALKSEELSAN